MVSRGALEDAAKYFVVAKIEFFVSDVKRAEHVGESAVGLIVRAVSRRVASRPSVSHLVQHFADFRLFCARHVTLPIIRAN